MGILIALIPAIAWGSIGLVSGKLGGNAYQQTLGMTFGALVFGIGTFLVAQPTLDAKVWLFGILSGLFWSLGQSQQFQAMKYIGVSLTVPMSTGMQLVANTLAGALLFAEWQTTKMVVLGLLALFALIAGAVLTSRTEKNRRGWDHQLWCRYSHSDHFHTRLCRVHDCREGGGVRRDRGRLASGSRHGDWRAVIFHWASRVRQGHRKKMSSPGCFGESGMFSC